MTIPVLIIVAITAVGALRPPETFNPQYYDSSTYFESPPLSLRTSFPSTSYLKPEPFFRNSKSVSDKDEIISDGLPYDYHEEQKIFDFSQPASSYLSFHKSPSFYQDKMPSFSENTFKAQDYRGPPPPISKQVFRNQMIYTESPRLNNSSQLRMANFQKEQTSPQPTTKEASQFVSPIEHTNHIDYGNHGIGFASINGVTPLDINPVAIAESSTTIKSEVETHSTVSLHSPSTNEIQISQREQEKQHPVTDSLSSGIFTSKIQSTEMPKNTADPIYTQSSTNMGISLNDLASTTPATMKMTSVMPESNLVTVRNPSNQAPESTRMFHEFSKSSYNLRPTSPEFTMAINEQQSIESSGQKIHVPHVKQNFFSYETKNSFPFESSHLQIHEKHHNNENIAPLRFSIPTASTSAVLPASTAPMKLVYQSLDFSRSALPLIAGSNSFSYTPKQNQLDVTNFGKLNSGNTLERGMPSYYLVQNNIQQKPSISSEIPLGSFSLMQRNEYPKQNVPLNFEIPLSTFGEKDYLQSSSNTALLKSSVVGLNNLGLGYHDPFRSSDPVFANIGLDHNSW